MTDAHAPFQVLFLCNSNCGRSLLAESILTREGGGRFLGHSAGVRPAAAANPVAIDLLSKMGHDVTGLGPKPWETFLAPGAPAFDFVFTVCDEAAAEPCPAWPGNPMNAHWSIPDPTRFVGSEPETYAVYEDVYRMILQRVRLFTSLPIRELDRMALHASVRDLSRAG